MGRPTLAMSRLTWGAQQISRIIVLTIPQDNDLYKLPTHDLSIAPSQLIVGSQLVASLPVGGSDLSPRKRLCPLPNPIILYVE
jgi:hypothetical protein